MSFKTDPAVIEKIRKVLAKAGNNPSLEEAETAAMMTQRLLLKHGLTMDEVVDIDDSAQKIVFEGSPDKGDHQYAPWWVKQLARIIGDNFRCSSFVRRHGPSSFVVFIGLSEDVEAATAVYITSQLTSD